jgi:hypothetical protein
LHSFNTRRTDVTLPPLISTVKVTSDFIGGFSGSNVISPIFSAALDIELKLNKEMIMQEIDIKNILLKFLIIFASSCSIFY